MDLDVNTLFMVTMYVEIMLGLLLFFAWAQNFSKRALAWWGSAHLMRAVSIMLLGLYGSVPDSLSIDLANAVLFGSFALTWCGARVFDRRNPEPALALVGVAVWLLACRLQAFATTVELRVLVGSGIVTAYTWAAAYEFWRGRDEALVSRWPAIFMLFAHGALFLLRTPIGAVAHVHARQQSRDERLARTAQRRGAAVHHLDRLHPPRHGQGAHRIPPPRRRPHRSAHRHRQPPRLPGTDRAVAALGGRPPADRGAAVRSRSLQDRSTTSTVTPSATARCRFSPTSPRRISATAGTVGRWGGDEFVAVLPNTSREIAATVAERIQVALEKAAADIDGRLVGATVCTGMAFSSHGAFELPAMLLQADQALYRAKSEGRNRLAIAHAGRGSRARSRNRPAARSCRSRRSAAA